MNTIYHLRLDESTKLPMSVQAVRDAWRRGRINHATPVWREGLRHWRRVADLADEIQLPEIGGMAPRQIAPLPRGLSVGPPPKRPNFPTGAITLAFTGLVLLAFFLGSYDVQSRSPLDGLLHTDKVKLQNRAIGGGAGAALVVLGFSAALLRLRRQ